jgi:zinc transporter ZupT
MTSQAVERKPAWLASGLIALVLIAAAFTLIVKVGTGGLLRRPPAPVQKLTFERVVLHPGTIDATVRSSGQDPVDIAQILINEAYWQFTTKRTHLGRLQTTGVHLVYPWVAGEPLTIMVVDSTGLTFEHEIEVATATPERSGRTLLGYVLLGTYAGVIPVLLGLLFLPVLQRVGDRGLSVLVGLTAGMLVFLAVEALSEALELTGRLAGAFQGTALVFGAAAASLGGLWLAGQRFRARRGGSMSPLGVAYLVAIGIGLHNMGEGLAIGSAHAVGEIALSTFLVLGFAVHNLTEGIGIVAPTVRTPPAMFHLLVLGAIAGLPTIPGTLLGALAYSPAIAILFLSVGVGAILQVVLELAGVLRRGRGASEAPALLGAATGFALMYATGLLIQA